MDIHGFIESGDQKAYFGRKKCRRRGTIGRPLHVNCNDWKEMVALTSNSNLIDSRTPFLSYANFNKSTCDIQENDKPEIVLNAIVSMN